MHATLYGFRAARGAARSPGIGSGFLVLLFALALWLVPTGLRAAPSVVNVVPIYASDVYFSGYYLWSHVWFGSQDAPATHPPGLFPITASPNPSNPGCPIVTVPVGNIDHKCLDDTGFIVPSFDMTFTPDNSTAFGAVMCKLGSAVTAGSSMGDFLPTLTTAEVSTLTGGLTDAINSVLVPLSSSRAMYSSQCYDANGRAELILSIPPPSVVVDGVPMTATFHGHPTLPLNLTVYTPPTTELAGKICHLRELEVGDASMSALQAQLHQISKVIYAELGL